MGSIRNILRRRWLTAALGGVVVAMVLLIVPMSYDRTIGHEVTLALRGAGMSQDRVLQISNDLRAVLETEGVRVHQTRIGEASSNPQFTLTAKVGDRSRTKVERAAAAFAATLAAQGITSNASVTPLVERVTGNVCAAATNSIVELQINTDSRSADKVAAEIRSQLEGAGVVDPEVEVDLSGGCCRIAIRVDHEGNENLPEIRCTPDEGGVPSECKQLCIKVERSPEMTDADVIAAVEQQLAEQGISGTVTLDANGQIQIELDDDCQ